MSPDLLLELFNGGHGVPEVLMNSLFLEPLRLRVTSSSSFTDCLLCERVSPSACRGEDVRM